MTAPIPQGGSGAITSLRERQESLHGSRRSNIGLGAFLKRFRASLVILSERGHGLELPLDQIRTTLGRGPGVDIAFDDQELARLQAIVEFTSGGFRIRGHEGSGGVRVNGVRVAEARLRHGDRIEFGEERLEFVASARPENTAFAPRFGAEATAVHEDSRRKTRRTNGANDVPTRR